MSSMSDVISHAAGAPLIAFRVVLHTRLFKVEKELRGQSKEMRGFSLVLP
jgi:hypothetical protein